MSIFPKKKQKTKTKKQKTRETNIKHLWCITYQFFLMVTSNQYHMCNYLLLQQQNKFTLPSATHALTYVHVLTQKRTHSQKINFQNKILTKKKKYI